MSEKQKQEVTILIAEDDDGHAELIRHHLREAGVTNPQLRFRDGQEIWNFLSCRDPQASRNRNTAYLLLLDIRMPKVDGVEVLRRLKADTELRKIPTVMLTTTDDPREIEQCYQLGCNAYITKPVEFARFAEALRRVGLFILIIQVAAINGVEH